MNHFLASNSNQEKFSEYGGSVKKNAAFYFHNNINISVELLRLNTNGTIT